MNRVLTNALEGTVRIMQKQQVHANNLANLSTTGFRADYLTIAAQTAPTADPADTTADPRLVSEQWSSLDSGPMVRTGQPLDLAINGEGWFTVIDQNGKEAFTRSGSFRIDEAGVLRTQRGLAVAGDGGPVVLPPFEQVVAGSDGRITVKPMGGRNSELAEVALLKLVNPPANEMSKGLDGLFRRSKPGIVPADPEIRLTSGALEGSNVNAVKEMVSFIELSREYEMQMKTMKSVETMGTSGDKLLRA